MASRGPFAALLVALVACALWLPLRGEIVYSTLDLFSYSVPELELHLNGNHGFGPALWDPEVGLGRPAIQTGGLSPASWPCFLASFWFDDAWELHSVLVLVLLVFGGLFAYGLFRELELAAWPSAACALGFGFSAFHARAGYQILCLAGSVWTMGLIWTLVANLRRPSFGRGLCFGAVIHSAILAAYPQQLVWAAWYGLCVLWAFFPARGSRLRGFAHLLLWGGIGLASTAPFLLDLIERAAESIREPVTSPLAHRPHGLREWIVQLGELGDPLWTSGRGFLLSGYSLWAVTCATFFGPGLLLGLSSVRTPIVRLSVAFVLGTLVFTYSEPAYRFGALHLGLGLSTLHPFSAANVPLFLLAAIGFDRAWNAPPVARRAALVLVPPVLAGLGALLSERPLVPLHVAISLGLALCAALVFARRSLPALGLGALLSAAHYGVAGVPTRALSEITRRMANELEWTEPLRRATRDGRIAVVGSSPPPWPIPNATTLIGLRSLQCYDALPPEQFKDWVRRLSPVGLESRDRIFRYMGAQGLESEDFARAGVRLVVTQEELDSPLLRFAGQRGEQRWFEVARPSPLQAWVPRAACRLEGGEASIPAPLAALAAPAERAPGVAERVELSFEPKSEPGLLWLSQQYHRRWRAHAAGTPLETVRIDGIWQGVLVPAGVERVELEFRPWIRWWWVPQLAFALTGLAWLCAHRLCCASRVRSWRSAASHSGTSSRASS